MLNLNIKIEQLLSNNASDFEIATVIKSYIKDYLNSLNIVFNQSQGKDFFTKHTTKIDSFIQVMYKYLLRKHFGSYMPTSNSIPITLIALGSYGREQLCVYSDIDIMLLYEDVSGFNITPIIEEFMTLAWDSGLKLGSSVHTLEDIETSAKSDITIKTSILESRLIYGSKHLWFYFQNKLANIRKFEQKEFVLEKIEEHRKRLIKYPLCMQPNIKDGYGGMRESNMLFWIATITYGITNVKELSGELFSEDEYKNYRISLEYIFRIRNALHLCAKKKLDIVNFDILPELSTRLGFEDKTKVVKESLCMTKLFNSLHAVHRFTSIMIKKIVRIYLFEKSNILNLKKYRHEKNIYIYNRKVYCTFHMKPKKLNTLLKLLLKLPDDVNSFDKSFQYFVYQTIKPTVLTNTIKQNIYTLLKKDNLSPFVKLIYNAKLLRVILPSLKKIINQAQFDGYHVHPVDIHTIQALWHIENIKDKFVYNLYKSLDKTEQQLLKLLCLFHDSGKGRGKDHHLVGEVLFKKFANSFHIDNEFMNLGARIVKYHNKMNQVATTEDIYSEDVILHFTGLLQNKQTLKLLYILTYADVSAVGEFIYSSNTANLLRELFLQSLPAFENKELLKISSRRIAKENIIKNSMLYQEQPHTIKKKILSISSHQLFLKYKALDIVKISLYANDTRDFYYSLTNNDILTIRITRVVPLNLGFLLGKINFLNLTSMGIYKLFDDKKFFEITFDKAINDDDLPYIKEIIHLSFDMTKSIAIKKPNIQEKEIIIDCNHTKTLAQLKINTKDQKGLFAFVAKVFDDFNIEIHSAKIYSSKGKINDLLLIEKNGNFCTNKDEILKKLVVENKSS
ncbi:[Protein-PII] uridylyltransferase [hydrothermal vent metagenome]|uniref:[Protein-PII] uridylyltransferase n=1 Tax=hydrothermal vent metagenome TaxID=652676 RepID=A0A3B1DSP9_9ZZZZ